MLDRDLQTLIGLTADELNLDCDEKRFLNQIIIRLLFYHPSN